MGLLKLSYYAKVSQLDETHVNEQNSCSWLTKSHWFTGLILVQFTMLSNRNLARKYHCINQGKSGVVSFITGMTNSLCQLTEKAIRSLLERSKISHPLTPLSLLGYVSATCQSLEFLLLLETNILQLVKKEETATGQPSRKECIE